MRKPLKQFFRQQLPLRREQGRRSALHLLFGRSAPVALLLIVQVILLIGLFMRWQFAAYAYGGTYLLAAAMAAHLINRPMNPSTRQTWLILIMLVPALGTLLYLYVETDLGHRLVRDRLAQISRETHGFLPDQERLMKRLSQEEPGFHALARYTQAHGGFPVYANTRVDYFPSGEEKFDALLQALEKAEHFIFLEYFILDEGEMWSAILDILARKAAEGVDVRVLYDGTCAFFRLPYHYPKKLAAMGIQCKMFSPIRPLVSTHYNNRDHRKIVVVDGHTAFTGGVNLADEYINRTSPHGHWKDAAVMLRGEAVRSFTLMFLQMWNVTERSVEYQRFLNMPLPAAPEAPGYVIPYGDSPFDNELVGESIYLDIINRSSKYVHIMTPYLIIDSEMSTALCFAAKRGVDVRLILPGIPDKKSAFSLAYTHYRELIEAGVGIYEYTPGFVHAKVFVSDDAKAVVGTINLDYRSLYLHFECAAYLYKVPAIDAIEQDFRRTLKQSEQITSDKLKEIPWNRKVRGFMLKLFAPLM